MSDKKTVLIIGIDPKFIDFTMPEFAATGLTAEKVDAGIRGSINKLNELGYNADLCWTDLGGTAIEVLSKTLQSKQYDCVLVGAGIRKAESNFLMFEKMINSIHEFAPKAKICFNTNPMDTIAAVQRWV